TSGRGRCRPPPGPAKIAAEAGTTWEKFARERPGVSAFVLEDGIVSHTYAAYSRGLDGLWGMYQWLDRAPRGRNEEGAGIWWRRHDEYERRAGSRGPGGVRESRDAWAASSPA